jgi:ElaB/YqjD/DUF883 family membrane-anchored ribosome-binding protein
MFASAEKINVNGKNRAVHKAAKEAHNTENDAEEVVSSIYEAAAAIKEDVETLAQTAGRRVRNVIDAAESNVSEVTGNMTSVIRDNPIQSSLAFLAAGTILGLMVRRW